MKITILYFSQTGNTEKMAGFVKNGILRAGDFDVRLMNIKDEKNIDVAFVNESSAVIFGTPCYVGNTCWQMKKFFDTRMDCQLQGKLAGCFCTANFMSGGTDTAILTVLEHAIVRGMLAYSSGLGYGKPFIHLGPIALSDELDEKGEMFAIFGERIARKAAELFK